MINKDELLFVVDENNNPLEPRPRKEVHANKIWHRVSHVFVKNSAEQILCHQRSILKDTNPGKWNVVFGGHLSPGEDYLEGAVKELVEESSLQVNPEDLKLLEVYKKVEDTEFQAVYLLNWDGDIRKLHFEEDEIDQLKWVDIHTLREFIRNKNPNWSFMGYEKELFNWLK